MPGLSAYNGENWTTPTSRSMIRHSYRTQIQPSPAVALSLIRAEIEAHDQSLVASVVRKAKARSFIDSVKWKAVSESRLEGALGFGFPKPIRGLILRLEEQGADLVVTVEDPSWLKTPLRGFYLVTAVVPPFWTFFGLFFFIRIISNYTAKRIPAQITDQLAILIAERQSGVISKIKGIY